MIWLALGPISLRRTGRGSLRACSPLLFVLPSGPPCLIPRTPSYWGVALHLQKGKNSGEGQHGSARRKKESVDRLPTLCRNRRICRYCSGGRVKPMSGQDSGRGSDMDHPPPQKPPGEAGGGPDKTGETRQSAQNNTPDHLITQRTPEVSRGRSGRQDGPSLRPAGATDTRTQKFLRSLVCGARDRDTTAAGGRGRLELLGR